MPEERLYIIHGTGPDTIGLVGKLTSAIATAGGNIVDLRQDVLHGLFTVFLVVDLSAVALRLPQLEELVRNMAEDTGLALGVEKYRPIARSAAIRNLLLVLIGFDRPGVIAEISATLGKYGANIEFSRMIARAGVFVMELLVDTSQAELPAANLEENLTRHMQALGITCLFQNEDVFNKKQRTLVFHLPSSLLDPASLKEVLDQCGLTAMDLANVVNMEETEKSLSRVAGLLQGLPGDLLERIIASCRVAPGSLELVQTLKVMGYRIVVVTAGIAPLADSLTTKLGLDACYGYPLAIHEDRRTVEPADGASLPDIETVKAGLLGQSGSSAADIIVLSDRTLGAPRSPGISLVPDLRQILEFTNQRILNRDQLLGILGAFGIPELPGRDS